MVYNDANHCKDDKNGAAPLWKLMLAIVIMGYSTFLLLCCVISCSSCLFCVLCGVIKGDKADKTKEKIPYANLF